MAFIAAAVASVGAAVASFSAAFPIAAAVAKFGFGLAVSLGLNFLSGKLNKQRPVGGVEQQVQFGGDVPCQLAVGTVLTKGQLLYWNTFYNSGDYTNRIAELIFCLADGQCQGLAGVWVAGEWHELEAQAVPGGNTEHARYHVAGYGDRFVVRFFDGRFDQNADAELVANAPDVAGGGKKWDAGRRLRCRCYVSISLYYKPELWPNGLPELEWELIGNRFYDARLDSTVAGGSGPHRFATPSTWTHNGNPSVAIAHYRRGYFVGPGIRIGGMGWPVEDLSLPHYMAAANICDEDASLAGGGTEDRYRASAILRDDVQHRDNLDALTEAMAGFEVERGGVMAGYAGAAQTPVVTITDADLVVGKPVKFSAQAPREETANRISGIYTEPEQHWGQVPFDTLINAAWETADGERLEARVDLPMVTSKTRAERIRSIRANETRFPAKAVIPVGYHRLKAEAGDWIVWNSARFGNRSWLITEDEEVEDGSLAFTLKEVASSIYSAAGLPLNPYTPPATPIPPVVATTVAGFTVQADTETESGTAMPVIRCTWTPPEDARVVAVILELRVVGTLGATRYRDDSPEDGLYVIRNIVGGVDYEVRATIVTEPPRTTTFTAWTAVLTDNVAPWDGDVSAIDAEIDQHRADAWATVNKLREEQRDLIEGLALSEAVSTGEGMLDRRKIREKLELNVNAPLGGLRGAIVIEQEVRAAQDGVLATLITTVEASLTGLINGNAAVVVALDARVVATENGLVIQAAQIVSTQADLDLAESNIAGHASTLATHNSRITTAENSIAVQAGLIATLQADLDLAEAAGALNASGLAALDARVTAAEGVNTSQGTAITAVQAALALKTQVFRQTSAPSAVNAGDLWIDTDDNMKLYRASAAGTGSWVDSTSANMTVFSQAAPPTTTVIGALWIETDNSNKLWRWDGSSWQAVDDSRIAANASAISTLQSTVTTQGGTISALSSAMTAVEAEVDGVNASGLIEIVAAASQSGVSSRIAIRTRATTGGSFAEAGLYIETTTGGVKRVVVLASQFLISDTVNGVNIVPMSIVSGKVRFTSNVEIDGNLTLTGTISTPKVANNAITETGFSNNDNEVWSGAAVGDELILAPVTVVVGSTSQVFIFMTAWFEGRMQNIVSPASRNCGIYRDTTLLVDNGSGPGNYAGNTYGTFEKLTDFYTEVVGAGTYTYSFRCGTSGFGGDLTVSIGVLVCKK